MLLRRPASAPVFLPDPNCRLLDYASTGFIRPAILFKPPDEQAEVILRVQKAFERAAGIAAEATRSHAFLDRLDQATLAKAFKVNSCSNQAEIKWSSTSALGWAL
jgi:hypothetical protein